MRTWIFPYLKYYKLRVFFSALFSLAGVFSGAMLLFISGYLISKSALRPENVMMIYLPIVAVRAFSISQAAFPYLEKLMSHDIVLRILAKYRDRLYEMLEPQAMFLQSRFQTGNLLHLLSEDIEKLQDYFIKTLLPGIASMIIYAVFLIVIGLFDWLFMLFMLLLLGIILFLIPWLSYLKMAKKHLQMKSLRAQLYESSTDVILGQLEWLVSGRMNEVIHQLTMRNGELMEEIRKVSRLHRYRDVILQFVVGVAIVFMMGWVDYQTEAGVFSPTIIAGFVLMMFSITDALIRVTGSVEEIPTYHDALHRMENLQQRLAHPEKSEGDVWEERNDLTINVQSVSYTYLETTEKVIDRLTFTIGAGEKVAIIGRSGAGKSTLLKLMTGLLAPDEGDVLIGGECISQAALSKEISILNQKPHLFHTSVANNVRIGNENATEEQIIEALQQAEIYDLITTLPHGLNTQMEEMGSRFSGGERQRIAFARALIQQTPILILDEPTTGLDQLTEMKLIRTFLNAAPEKTMILVTHHLSGAEWMDKIIVIDDGKIILEGSHETLMHTSEYYRNLYEMDQGVI